MLLVDGSPTARVTWPSHSSAWRKEGPGPYPAITP